MLRVGIIGMGVGERHISGFQRHSQCTVVALCDIDEAKRAAVRAKYPEMRIYDDANDLIDAVDIDVVSIASYDDAHAAQTVRAIRNGKHAFVEKPLALNRREAEEIREALDANRGVRLSSNLVLRTVPRFLAVKQMIDDGAFGKIYYAEGDYNYGRLNKITSGWRGRLPFYSVMLGGGVHMVDLLVWLSGERVVEVQAMGNALASAGSGFGFNDCVVTLLRFESGAVGKVAANFGCVYPHFHRLSIYGTDSTFENGLGRGRLWRSRDPAVPPEGVDAPYPGTDKSSLIPAFVDAVLTGSPGPVPEEDVFTTVSICLSIEEAMTTGRPTPVVHQ